MNIALWIVAGLLAVMYVFAGLSKTFSAKSKLDEQLGWPADVSTGTVRFVGIVEVLGAVGLVVPLLTGIAPILTPLAAVGLAIVQLLAVIVHVRRRENNMIPVNVVLLLLALFVAVGRFAGWGA